MCIEDFGKDLYTVLLAPLYPLPFEALDLKPLSGFIFGSLEFKSSTALCK